ncbi:His-Xaa-Ser system radical SAM maturase HxsB [Sphingomonas soli]|uniref:His-Xaa-Ser system radical SAM maturase HxsB n=1 Tax=Sphingomonas soli TaxID=266127 RepID=UPI00082EB575|nr:His-Xaa-Ser system radical SAM maturase HxsB [Sphingomonas soli]
MTFLPLRVRATRSGDMLCVNDTGSFFATTTRLLDRLGDNQLTPSDLAFLKAEGHAIDPQDRLGDVAYLYNLAERATFAEQLDYLILVPTLRCNLSCSYCQVSRAGLNQPGFDWDDATLTAVLEMLDTLPSPRIKIEFQGGEPTLRPDLIRAVIERCERFEERQFVICTNLQRVDDEILALFERPDLYISTSLDGDALTHQRNRTATDSNTDLFLHNLKAVIDRYGPHKISALPTIDPTAPPDIDTLIDSYAGLGFDSIFLRPINFQGFARKRHSASREQDAAWRAYHERFVRRIIERNWRDRSTVLEETYTSICLRRIFQPGAERHVDLRNPNPLGIDYVVIDHDGTVYPTDEARMLSRSGVIDLSIGDVISGWQSEQRDLLNAHASNFDDPACQRCTYQPYCGRDLVDDISRYGRIDMPRLETEFCRRHLHLFDFLFELIYDNDPATRYSLSRWLRLDSNPERLGARYT